MWTAYCSCLVDCAPAESQADMLPSKTNKQQQQQAPDPSKLLNVLLAGDNCMLYSWCVAVLEDVAGSGEVPVNMSTSVNAMRVVRRPLKAHLVGIVEMPIKVSSHKHICVCLIILIVCLGRCAPLCPWHC